MVPQFTNPILTAALQVVLGNLPHEEAAMRVAQKSELTSMPDARLLQVIAEARRGALDSIRSAASNPHVMMPYAELLLACASERTRAVAALRDAADPADHPTLDARLSRWFGVMADGLVLNGMAALCIPEPRMAVVVFTRAEWQARALPDDGKLRLRDVLASWYGRGVCGIMLGDAALKRAADEAVHRLVYESGRQAEAEAHLGQIRDEFELIRERFR